ncbi:unnamed protein product [Paramecium octaurelia]|uniref:Serine aminopeptidase S33 domain-containing protein n=1 Tax=Paramecium octaurelia TaxID=43137 RepID=A0A8S1UPB8_PAROT|nr:unnamed protein product [Paramecium octaurelia]
MSFISDYCKQIIRPPRRTYSTQQLGPKLRFIQSVPIIREDFEFTSRQLKLQASYFISESVHHRCLIYLHCNASCRLEGLQYVDRLLATGVNLCIFDFAGCGLSEGKYITMGTYESEDVKELMNYIECRFGKVDEFILWGRSMGAVTALMLSQDPRITTYIADSAFTQLRTVVEELGQQKFGCFSFMINGFMPFLRSKIINEAQFDIDQVSPLNYVGIQSNSKRFYFLAGKTDQLVHPRHSQMLYERCKSYKRLELCDGNHNTTRQVETLDKISKFINLLQLDLPFNTDYSNKCSKYFKEAQQCLNSYRMQQEEQEEQLKEYVKQLERKSILKSYQQQQRDLSDLEQYLE